MPIREKFTEELTGQMREVSRTIGESIATPTVSAEAFASLSAGQLQRLFPRRFEIYRKVLSERSTAAGASAGLSDRELASMREHLRMLNAMDHYIATHPTGVESERPLEPFQVDAIRATQRFIEEGHTRGYLRMAGGTGKTVIYTKLIDVMRPKKTLIISPSQPSVKQIKGKIELFAPDLDAVQVYQFAKDYGHNVTITTPNSYLKDSARDTEYARQFDVVIFDEAHRYLAPRMRAGAKAFRDDALMLGFTQTDRYSEEKQVANFLPILIHDMSISEAVAHRAMSAYQVIFLDTQIDISDVTITPDGDLSEKETGELSKRAGIDQTMIKTYKKFTLGKRGMAFFDRKQDCILFAEQCNQEGVRAAAVYSGMKEIEFENIMQAHRNGDIDIVVGMKKLAESYDDPGIEVILCNRPTISPVRTSQRCTRATRIPNWEREILKKYFPDEQNRPRKVALIIEAIYQSKDPRRTQVTFPMVAGGSFVFPKSSPDGEPSIYLPPVLEQVYTIDGLRVIADHSMVYEMTEQMEKDKYGDPEAGWLPLDAITQDPYFKGVTPFLITATVYRFSLAKPEWMKPFMDRNTNKLVKHYSPQLIEELKKEFPLLPEGWTPEEEVLKTYRIGRETLRRTARAIHEYLRIPYDELLVSRGRSAAISARFEKILPDVYTPVPSDSRAFSELEFESGGRVSQAQIRAFVEPYRTSHPDWIIAQKSTMDKYHLHLKYTPGRWRKKGEYLTNDLCNLIRDYFDFGKERVYKGKPRPGWRTHTSLEAQYGPVPAQVQQAITTDPDASEFRYFGDVVARNYHPRIFEVWEREARRLAEKHSMELRKRYRPAPQGWVSLYEFWRETKFETPEILKARLERMEDPLTKTAHSLIYFLDANGIPNLHIDPTRVQMARLELMPFKVLGAANPPTTRWRDDSDFEAEYGYPEDTIDKLAGETLEAAMEGVPEDTKKRMERASRAVPDADRILYHKALARLAKHALPPRKAAMLERSIQPRPTGSRSTFELARELGLYTLAYPGDYTQEEKDTLFLACDANGIPNEHFPANVVAAITERFMKRDVTPWSLEGLAIPQQEKQRMYESAKRVYPTPPEGAMNAKQLGRALHVNPKRAEDIAFTILASAIGTYGTYQEEGADKAERYYSKEVCDRARGKNPAIPREWLRENRLIRTYGYGGDLYDVLLHLSRTRKDLCINQGTKYGLSPEGESLFSRIFDPLPAGSAKVRHIATRLHRSIDEIEGVVTEFRKSNPKLFFYQRRPAGIEEHLTARLVALVTRSFEGKKIEKPHNRRLTQGEKRKLHELLFGAPYDAPREDRLPYGWRDHDSLTREYGKMGEHTQRYIAQHWMSAKMLPLPKSKVAVRCYGPDVIYEWEKEAIEHNIANTAFKEAPKNMISLSEFARSIGRDSIDISDLTDNERKLLFIYKDKRGLPVDHIPVWTAGEVRTRIGVRRVDDL